MDPACVAHIHITPFLSSVHGWSQMRTVAMKLCLAISCVLTLGLVLSPVSALRCYQLECFQFRDSGNCDTGATTTSCPAGSGGCFSSTRNIYFREKGCILQSSCDAYLNSDPGGVSVNYKSTCCSGKSLCNKGSNISSAGLMVILVALAVLVLPAMA